jgi:hypothetical protein
VEIRRGFPEALERRGVDAGERLTESLAGARLLSENRLVT